MPYIRTLLTLLLHVVILIPVLAQEPSQPVRLELPFTSENIDVEVIALPDSSLLVYHKSSNAWQTKASFHFTKYNSQLEQVWSDTASLSPDSYYIRSYTEQPYTYLVFGADDQQEYTFVQLHNATGQLAHKRYELDPLDAIYEYQVLLGNFFVIGRNKKDQKQLMLYLNPADGHVKPLPSVYGDESSFSDLLTDPEYNRVDAVITESNGRISRLQVKSFDTKGKLLNNYFILQKEDKSLLNAEVTPGDSTQKLLIGTYGTRDLRYNQGFFTAPLGATAIADGEFYNMLQLKNFLKYMKPRREERTRRRETKRLKMGRTPRYHYRLLLHDLITTPTGYVLAAEAYYPQYSSNTRNMGIDRTITLGQLQDGYKRTHAIALGFDKNGVLLWDNTFPLVGVSTYELTHAVEVQSLPDGRVLMAYPRDNTIIYHLMDEDKYDREETELELLTYEEDEKVIDTDQAGIIRWYGNSMAAYGFQRIKPKNGDNRMVFYINKLTF